MASGIYTALSGAVAQTTALDVTSNNIANASTTGYRTVRAKFDEVLTRARLRDQHMVRPAGMNDDEQPGNIIPTGNPLDLALEGAGYIAVLTPHGERFTRAGNLRFDAEGRLATADGNPVAGVDGRPIAMPPGAVDVQIREDGLVVADGNEVGTIKLKAFASGALTREGATLYAPVPVQPGGKVAAPSALPPASQVAEPPRLVVGAVERANFSIVRGVVDLVKTSRTYEALHRMIESYKEIDDRAARNIGGNG